jgi:transposase-like protein
MSGLLAPQFQNDEAARAHLEKTLWPDGPVCPKCGIIGEAFRLKGETNRDGLYKCSACREPFTVTIGTIFEDSHIPLHKWLLAIHLLCSSKKGMSAHQLWRNLWGINPETGRVNGSYRTAWFLAHRIRWALGQEPVASRLSGIIEIDETFVGGKRRYVQTMAIKPGERKQDRLSPFADKAPVLTILQRDGGVRSQHVERVTSKNLKPIIEGMIDLESAHVITDSSTVLESVPMKHKHSQVNHNQKEYVRREDGVLITTNTVESYFATLKRGLNGIYHHVGKAYLDQYLREFDFRHNIRKLNDDARATVALRKTKGRRMMLKDPKGT